MPVGTVAIMPNKWAGKEKTPCRFAVPVTSPSNEPRLMMCPRTQPATIKSTTSTRCAFCVATFSHNDRSSQPPPSRPATLSFSPNPPMSPPSVRSSLTGKKRKRYKCPYKIPEGLSRFPQLPRRNHLRRWYVALPTPPKRTSETPDSRYTSLPEGWDPHTHHPSPIINLPRSLCGGEGGTGYRHRARGRERETRGGTPAGGGGWYGATTRGDSVTPRRCRSVRRGVRVRDGADRRRSSPRCWSRRNRPEAWAHWSDDGPQPPLS